MPVNHGLPAAAAAEVATVAAHVRLGPCF